MHYGSFAEGTIDGDDSVEAQRENEALQRVVAKASRYETVGTSKSC